MARPVSKTQLTDLLRRVSAELPERKELAADAARHPLFGIALLLSAAANPASRAPKRRSKP